MSAALTRIATRRQSKVTSDSATDTDCCEVTREVQQFIPASSIVLLQYPTTVLGAGLLRCAHTTLRNPSITCRVIMDLLFAFLTDGSREYLEMSWPELRMSEPSETRSVGTQCEESELDLPLSVSNSRLSESLRRVFEKSHIEALESDKRTQLWPTSGSQDENIAQDAIVSMDTSLEVASTLKDDHSRHASSSGDSTLTSTITDTITDTIAYTISTTLTDEIVEDLYPERRTSQPPRGLSQEEDEPEAEIMVQSDAERRRKQMQNSDLFTTLTGDEPLPARGLELQGGGGKWGSGGGKLKSGGGKLESGGGKLESGGELLAHGTPVKSESVLRKQEEELEALVDEKKCKICTVREIDNVLLPCGHYVVCSTCGGPLDKCPLCRTNIEATVKALRG